MSGGGENALPEPAFRPVDRHGRLGDRRLSGQGAAIVVKRHMGRLGHPVADFAGHSLRRGHATTAVRNGASDRTVMRTTGHVSVSTLQGWGCPRTLQPRTTWAAGT